jgi:hypothetical protein
MGFCHIVYREIQEIEADLHGAMRGTVTILPGVDLTESTGVVWDAQQPKND